MSAAAVRDALARQVIGCRALGSPLGAGLLEGALRDFDAGGACRDVLGDWRGDPGSEALALRFLGAVHRAVLRGEGAELAAHFPTMGGSPSFPGAAEALLRFVADQRESLRREIRQPVQTNEVARSAALYPGLLTVARATELPLRLLEVGASAGLNLICDRYAYRLGPHVRGRPDAPLTIDAEWRGGDPPPDGLEVATRAGCDPAPVDARDPAQRLLLASFVWPDQLERWRRLEHALALAAEAPPSVERLGAAAFAARELSRPVPGAVTVILHSVVWQYLDAAEREAFTARVEEAGHRATQDAPVAWLRLEGDGLPFPELGLQLWPGGDAHRLARSHWHGQFVEWLSPGPPPTPGS